MQIGQEILQIGNPHHGTLHCWWKPRYLEEQEKKKLVALSSDKVEFRGMAKGLCELLWLRNLLN